jgi:hypothetical protein
LAEIWLNIPQAIVLEATKNLERARGLKEREPQLLLLRAALLLPPLGTVPVKPDASADDTRLALRTLKEEMDSRTSQRCYDVFSRRVHAKMSNGVTTKGRRGPNLPLKLIDPAEIACFELDGVDAVDPRTGKIIFYDLVVSARELVDDESGDPFSSESSSPEPPKSEGSSQELIEDPRAMAGETARIGSAKKPAASMSERDLRSWYEQRVSKLSACGEASSGEADWEAAKQQIPGLATRSRLRQVRDQFAPSNWKKQGRRSAEPVK